jgi:hypothetical protein
VTQPEFLLVELSILCNSYLCGVYKTPFSMCAGEELGHD